MTAPPAVYIPTSDAIDRHEYGVTKNRKTASTGGGRAWSEDEEVYLLQTRMQKMPYKHIAAHLKKTELACRLHYHQLSHGSNRRKRTTSVSSGSSTGGHSPVMPTSMPSPIHEHDGASSRSVSPPGSAGSYAPTSPNGIQLPSIMNSHSASPRLPAILPKPASMTLALSNATSMQSPTAARGYPTPLGESHPHSAPLMASASFRSAVTPTSAAAPLSAHTSNGSAPGPLRLDCSALPPMSTSMMGHPYNTSNSSHPVDMARLNAIYSAHRASFWATVASDYGCGASPIVLEQAWRSNQNNGSSVGITAQTPITPIGSPDDHVYGSKPDKTRISAILGIDANPRSPREREMVRRMEEERCAVGVGA